MPIVTQIPSDVYTSADFVTQRRKLIDFFSNQEEFKDYDFAGSRLSLLIDLLAYNTLYIEHFANAAIYESFGRTARLRSSVVQHAQDDGYLPDSRSASRTQVAVKVKHPSNPTAISIPKGTKFVGVVDKTYPYDFVTWEDVTVLADRSDPEDVSYKARLNLAQGRIIRTTFEYSNTSRIVIQNKNIDRKYIRVYINGAEWKDWTNRSIVTLTGLSNVFYIRETLESFTEIFFGEGEGTNVGGYENLRANYIGGLKPTVGSVITIEYISTAGEEANGSRQISYVDSLTDLEFQQIIENPDNNDNYTGTDGGGEPEDIERIREMSPILRETQRRCVTNSDYDSFVSYRFGSIVQAIQTFTDSTKPGYAFIAIKPKSGLTLTTVQKEDIQTFLNEFNMGVVTPIVTDPKYLYVKHDVTVQYRINNLSESEEWLRGKVVDSIDRYYTENVEIFNRSFHSSKMMTYIDDAHVSILGSKMNIRLIREESNFYKTPMAGIKFMNPLEQQSMVSSHFTFTNAQDESYDIRYASTGINQPDENSGLIVVGPFKDGDINMTGIEYTGTDFKRDPSAGERTKYYTVGTINYVLDKVDFDLGALNQDSTKFTGAYIELEGQPLDPNVYVKDGSLLVFENDLRPQYTNITMEPIIL
ncbi:MAG: baseplate wedge subunit [Bacilli bacterium]